MQPTLTRMSRKYGGSEFVLDTKDILNKINEMNNNNSFRNQNINLFTLDVEKLYLSIQPQLAMEACKTCFQALMKKIGRSVK